MIYIYIYIYIYSDSYRSRPLWPISSYTETLAEKPACVDCSYLPWSAVPGHPWGMRMEPGFVEHFPKGNNNISLSLSISLSLYIYIYAYMYILYIHIYIYIYIYKRGHDLSRTGPLRTTVVFHTEIVRTRILRVQILKTLH